MNMKKIFYGFELFFVMNVTYHAHGMELPEFLTAPASNLHSAGNIDSSKVVPSSVTTPNDSLEATECSSSTKTNFTETPTNDYVFTYRDMLSELGLKDEEFRQLLDEICKTPKGISRDAYERLGLLRFFDSDLDVLIGASRGSGRPPDELYSRGEVDALSRLINVQALINEVRNRSTEQHSPQIISSRTEKSVVKAPLVVNDGYVVNYSELLVMLDVRHEEFIGLLHEIEAASPNELVNKYEEIKFAYDGGNCIKDHDQAEQIFILDKAKLNSLKTAPSSVFSRVYSNEYVAALYRLTTALRALDSDKSSEAQRENRHFAPERNPQQNNSTSRLEEIGENISREGGKGLNAFNRNVVQRFGGFVARGFK